MIKNESYSQGFKRKTKYLLLVMTYLQCIIIRYTQQRVLQISNLYLWYLERKPIEINLSWLWWWSSILSNSKLEMLVFVEGGKPEDPEENPWSQTWTNKNSTHIRHRAEIKPGLHWWEISILTTVPTLRLISRHFHKFGHKYQHLPKAVCLLFHINVIA